MPRRRADQVIEHRLSLSDGLHKELKQTLASNKTTNQVAMVGNAGKAIMNVAAVGAIGAIAYLGVKAYAIRNEVFGEVKQSFQKAWDWGFGVETNADGTIVPTTVTITNAYGNQETVVNPINAIPILNKTPFVGGLFDWGMKLGAATNPFEDFLEEEPQEEVVPDDSIWEAHLDEQFFEEHGYSRQYWEWYQAKIAEDPDFDFFGAAFENLPDWSEHEIDSAAFARTWATSMEALMREEMGDEWVDERLAEDPDFFAWKTIDITEGIGGIDVDLTPDPTQTGQSPIDPDSPMNWMAWLWWVDAQGFGRIDKNVDVGGYTVNLGWYHLLYLEFWNANFGP